MEETDFSRPVIRTRQAMLDAGLDDNHIRRALASGELVRIRRGCYADAEPPLDGEANEAKGADEGKEARKAHDNEWPQERRVLEARVGAVAVRFGGRVVFSHATAAELWGLPFLGTPPETTHITVPRAEHGDRRAMVHQHPGALVPAEIVVLGGVRTTSLPRTLVDVARTEGFRAGLVMADHALRMSRNPGRLRQEMLASIDRLKGTVGIGEARRMASFAVAEAESPGESLSRIIFSEQLIPTPQLQFRLRLRSPGGALREYRTDFAWEPQRVVGEFDGRMKYERYAAPGESPGDVVFREKRREDALRAAGWTVVRWIWSELDNPAKLGRKVRDALEARSR